MNETARITTMVTTMAALLLGVFTTGYLTGGTRYHALAAAVEQQKVSAKKELERLTQERDIAQAALAHTAKQQEKKDAQALAEIERLDTELRNRPIRVRIEAGACSSSSADNTAAGAGTGGANTSPTYGVLPAANSRSLGRAIKEIETLSAAYASCRSALYDATKVVNAR